VALGTTPGWTVPPAIAFIGFCTGVAGPSRDLLVRSAALTRFGPGSFGRIYGFVYSGFDVGGATAPLLFAGFLDRGLFRSVLVGVAVLQVLALLTALNIGRGALPRLSFPDRAPP
jgi:FSR family fosmidomycin resistance protein-like MFS transporter